MKAFRFFLCFALLGLAKISLALPPGSYLDTCQNCTQFLNTLTCSCMNRQQMPVMSSLWNINQCSYISNENGQLTCHHVYNPMPQGSYKQTCRFCHIDYSGNLQCQCRDRNAYWHPSTLFNAYNCPWVSNQNGQLTCGENGGNYNNSLPNGNYMNSCQGCRMNGPNLFCSCQKRDGSYQPTNLYNAASCNFVSNINGQLICPMGSSMGTDHYK